jgi:predicted transcriptional regulator
MKSKPQIITTLAGVLALALAVLGVVWAAWLVIPALAVWFGGRSLARSMQRKAALHEVPVRAAMRGHIDTVEATEALEVVATRLVATGLEQMPIVDHGHTVGVITRDDVASGIREVGPDASVAIAPHHDAVTVEPDVPLDEVIDKMHAKPDAVAVVVDHGTPVGLVSKEQLAAYLTLLARAPRPT